MKNQKGRIIQRQAPEIHVKVKLIDPDEVSVDETKFRETLLEVTLQTVCEGEVNLDEVQILGELVHFSEDASALQSHRQKRVIGKNQKPLCRSGPRVPLCDSCSLDPEQLRKAATVILLPPPAMSTPLTHAIICHDDEGACQLVAIG